ncbi:chromate resistance protein ChrB domain-containing protein [Stagnihabitans tardus]|uniref:Sulfurtransferase n=1 Tax=Stagnihabitans tardus TaxID=2699202 RepID=A0AAE4Y653_9RHOB|nr:sulfurtransferase/chromate resistance protein [Stagnihabitans tardus]NBZ86518.1 sulfurtransferase [Stagnihabitans tardus]
MPAPDAMSCDQLARLVGTPKAPILLDVRRDAVRAQDPRFLPGARALAEADLAPGQLSALAATLSAPVVVICAEGHRLSQGTAAWLRHEGLQAEYLIGGHAAWAAAGLPLVDPAPITARDEQGRSVWVTRARPKIDRIACPWLIRRFIDPQAVFLFVAPAEVQAVAERFGAMAYDIEGVFWSHRGETCTFDTLLAEFGLSTPALDRLARIVRGADTGRPDLAPECAGLLAASLGLSRMHSDDLAQLEAGMGLYDAFYRWARDATEEQHTWPNGAKK